MVRAITALMMVLASTLIALAYVSLVPLPAELTIRSGTGTPTASPTDTTDERTTAPVGDELVSTESPEGTLQTGARSGTPTRTPSSPPAATETETATATQSPVPVQTRKPTPTPETPTATPAIDAQVETPAPPPVTAQTADRDAPPTDIVSRFAPDTPGGAVHAFRFDMPDDVTQLGMYIGDDVPILETDGMVASDDGWVRWDGTTPNPSLTLQGREFANGRRADDYHVDDDWAVVPFPTYYVYYVEDGERRAFRTWNSSHATHEVDGRGTGASSVVYFGPYDEYTRDADGQTLRLIVPERASLADRPADVLDSVTDARRRLAIGDDDPEISMLVAPEPVREGGYAGDNGFVVGTDGNVAPSVESPNNPWIHEYVHTTRSFDLWTELDWFTEADASYAAARTTYIQRGPSGRQTDGRLHLGFDTTAVLADRTTWESPRVPYWKGAAVLYVLDGKIRDATDGKRTLEDVVARMERHEGSVTHADFKRYVAEVAGTPMDGWLDERVLTDGDVEELRDRNGFLENAGRLYDIDVNETETTFDVTVAFDGTIDHGDLLSDGDPYLEILVDGESVTTIRQVPWELHQSVTVSVPPAEFATPTGAGTSRNVTVVLWDRDFLEDDQLDRYVATDGSQVTPTANRSPRRSSPTHTILPPSSPQALSSLTTSCRTS